MAKANEDELQTVTNNGNIVEKRIPTAKTAISIYKKLRRGDSNSALARSRIQNIYNGNPPYSKAEIRRRGLAWMSNVDWGEFRSSINLNASAVWNMLVDVPVFIDAQVPFKDAQNPHKNWGLIMAQAYSQVLREWEDFYFVMMMRIQEMMKHGNGPVIWQDEEDWRSVNVRVANLLVPATSSSCVSKMFTFCVRQEMDPLDLYRTILDEKIATDMGWNVKEVKKTLVAWFKNRSHGVQDQYAISDWESLEQMVKNMDDASYVEFSSVRLVHLYSREKDMADEDKTITHQIIWEGAEEDGIKFLYERQRRYDRMSQALHLLLFTIGDGYMKSVRGLGREIFHSSHASNRLINSMLTGADMASGLMLQLKSGQAAEDIQVTRKGPLYLIPAGVDAQQRQIMPSIDPLLGARKVIGDIENNNAGVYKGKDEQLGPARSATQIQQESFNEARFEGNQSVFYYTQMTEWHKETFRRLKNPDYSPNAEGYDGHARLIELLKEEDFPMHLLGLKWIIKSKRAIGLGSLSQKMAITNQMVSMKGSLTEIGQHHVDRYWFAVRVGWENVDEFVPPLDDKDMFTMIHSMAESENVDMMMGQDRTVAVDDPHGMHTVIHLNGIKAVVDQFRQSQNPEVQAKAMQFLLKHTFGHVELMMNDPSNKAKAEMYVDVLKQYSGIAKEMEAVVAQIQKQREKQQEENQKRLQKAEEAADQQEHELKIHKIDKDAEVGRYEADKQHEARMDKALTAAQAKTIELEAKLVNMERETNAKISKMQIEMLATLEKAGVSE